MIHMRGFFLQDFYSTAKKFVVLQVPTFKTVTLF